jgi:hypothetical protein
MSQPGFKKLQNSIRLRWATWQNRQNTKRIAQQIAAHSKAFPAQKPVVVFNASARLTGLSQNAAFSLLTAWSLRLSGMPVIHFACRAGMSHCVQGTSRQDYTTPPPCAACVELSRRLYQGSDIRWFRFTADQNLSAALKELNITQLSAFEYSLSVDHPKNDPQKPFAGFENPLPLGKLVLPSIRWALRCHTLPDDEPTRYLFREYILSAHHVAREFAILLKQVEPAVAIIFNGIMFPEAAACWVARQMGVRVITHEVGFQPFSAFFTDGEATAYPIYIPNDFELDPAQNARLDAYLEQRFKGKFTMAGIRFWPEMASLDDNFLKHASQFHQIVPVFTNVIYDTSQVHANTILLNMFEWLNQVLTIIRSHPETLFVIRAHPDEMRPGTKKQSRESVRDWVYNKKVTELPNVVFIDSQEYISSYELIRRSKFLMVYNSSIGLEASLMGVPVLCGGKARYTQYPTVFLPSTIDEFYLWAEKFLKAKNIDVPPELQLNARHFLYYQLYRVSLPFGAFLKPSPRPGFVQFQPFSWQELQPESSTPLRVIHEGIRDNCPFLLTEDNANSSHRKN